MKNYLDLKEQIKGLICRGHFRRFDRKHQEPMPRSQGSMERYIDVIIDEPTSGGDNFLSYKVYT